MFGPITVSCTCVHVLHATENKNVVKLDNIFFLNLLDKCNTRKDKGYTLA